jgi:hypothetical protein
MNQVVIVDTRNQKDDFVVKALEKLGCTVIRSKLPFGDVALATNILNCIDLKSSGGGGLIEIARNVCSKDHNRVRKEIDSCLEVNGKITFMCFEPGINNIDEVINWKVPRYKANLFKDKPIYNIKGKICAYERICLHKKGQLMTKVKPETLMKALKTMTEQDHYKPGTKVEFIFATKENCGELILKILNN